MNRTLKIDFIDTIKHKIDVKRYEKERITRLFYMFLTEVGLLLSLYGGYHFILFLIKKSSQSGGDFYTFAMVIFGIIYFIIFVCFIMAPGLFDKDFKDYLKDLCQNDIRRMLDLKTLKCSYFSESDLKQSNLFSTFNRTEYDDVIRGEYKDVSFTVAEIELRDVRGSGKNRQDWTTFKGIVISFPANKKINADTLITTKGDANIRNYLTGTKFNLIFIAFIFLMPIVIMFPIVIKIASILVSHGKSWKFFSSMLLGSLPGDIIILFVVGIIVKKYLDQKKKMQDVQTEDIAFDKKFCLYSQDQVEARYLVTSVFMDRMKKLQTAFGTKKIKCSFFDDKIMFAMSTNKDLFELGSLWRPFGKDIEDFYDEIISIHEMIDHFKLNEKTGL